MNLLSGTTINTFSLLSIGQRGVGKTVFLAGSCANLQVNNQTPHSQRLWFDCRDAQIEEKIGKILNYVVQTGKYPPPTMKVTDFNFSLKRQTSKGVQTLCHFRWWDIPGEICNIHNSEFKKIVYAAQGCCVFIDVYALVHNHAYLQTIEDIIEQVMAIANLVHLNQLKYAFALILTKCDLLEPEQLKSQQIEQGLQPLIAELNAVKANYQTFYSFIPIVNIEGASTLRAKGADAPLLWLVSELSKAHNPSLSNNLIKFASSSLTNRPQPQQERIEGSLQSLKTRSKAAKNKKILGIYLIPSNTKAILLLLLASVAAVGVVSYVFVDYKKLFQGASRRLNITENIADAELQRAQSHRAIPLMEKLVQQQPKSFELRLQLAHLYENTGQIHKAEIAYDQVLAQQRNNLKALLGKAVLRNIQGDTKTAEALFLQAENAAPTDFKAKIRALAQKTLQISAESMPSAK